MNIFVLHKDPDTAARMQCDKHVVKMVLETAQLLCSVAHSKGKVTPYKPTHKNHPCTIWAGASKANWNWLIDHGLALCDEYTKRYGKTHKSQKVIERCKRFRIRWPEAGPTPFAQAMPDQYRALDPVLAYRNYYKNEKREIATWNHTEAPAWWN